MLLRICKHLFVFEFSSNNPSNERMIVFNTKEMKINLLKLCEYRI